MDSAMFAPRQYGHGHGHGHGHGGHHQVYSHTDKSIDLYSTLAVFSFLLFLGYLLYNFIQTQANGRRSLSYGVSTLLEDLSWQRTIIHTLEALQRVYSEE